MRVAVTKRISISSVSAPYNAAPSPCQASGGILTLAERKESNRDVVMSGEKFVVLEDRGVLAISGPDRAAFLQGLISNDVTRVSGERAIYAALLTPQGKYLHDFMLA